MKTTTPSRSALARRVVPVVAIIIATTLNIKAAEADKAAAAPKDAAPIELATMVVTATRYPIPVERTAASVSSLSTSELSASGITTADEALRMVPGLTIASNGPGQTVGVFTRGTVTRHTSILVNGRRMPTALARSFDLTYFPTNAFERIEIARGPLSSSQGGSALGGAINFLTPQRTSESLISGTISAEYGSFESQRLDVNASAYAKKTYLNVAASESGTNNDRVNNEFDAHSALTTFGATLTDTVQLDVLVGYVGYKGGTPGSLSSPSATQSFERELFFVMPSVTLSPSEMWTHTFTASLAYQHDQVRGTAFTFDDDKTVNSNSVGYQVDFRPLDTTNVQVGVEKGWQDLKTTPVPGPSGAFATPFSRYEVYDAIFAGVIQNVTDALTLLGSVRRDAYQEFYGSANTWRYGAAYDFKHTGTTVHFSDGTAFAAPENQNFAFSSVKALDPEKSRGQEVGVFQQWKKNLGTGVTLFRSQIDNLVEFVSSKPVNIGKADIRGVESELIWLPVESVSLNLNYTYLEAENAVTGVPLIRRPKHVLNAQASWNATAKWLVGTGIRANIERFDGSATAPTHAEDFTTVRIFTRYQLTKNWSFKGRVENALNEDYAEVRGFPSLPFGAYGSAEWHF